MQQRAKKSLGQHFLKNPAISRRIVDLLRPETGDRILEIGPGPGALTDLLAEARPACLLILEKDEHWAGVHAARHARNEQVRVVAGDALAWPWESLAGPWKVISNLPYNVGSPLIWDVVSRMPGLTRAVFMVQKEVAERLAARPGGRDYGALSVWVQSFVRVEWGFVVGPGNFAPPPKVDSAVVAMSPLVPRPHVDCNALNILLKICFQQRRKQLQSLLRRRGVPDAAGMLQGLSIDPAARPETLSPEKFHDLALKCAPFLLTSVSKHG